MSDLARAHRHRIAHLAEQIAAGKRVRFLHRSTFGDFNQMQLVAQVEGEQLPVTIFTSSHGQFKRLLAAVRKEFRSLEKGKAAAA